MARLLVVRHAESVWNAAGRWQGRGDPPLSPEGREQAVAAASRLRGEVSRVATSSLVRARQTAELIAERLELPEPEVDPDLREIDVGVWTGMTRAEVERRYADELRAWSRGELEAPPGGEDRDDFLARLLRAMRGVAERHPTEPVLVVTHGGCIGRLERHLGVHPGEGTTNLTARWFHVDGGELSVGGDRMELLEDRRPPPPDVH